ncbi:hypothetical protein EDD17DRAFT_1605846 [Pisolithus thermaeus]|nr:hypothetical protein EV401DRAFT_1961295 [Pisolithus croceorrhizus]KAI6160193.1 hypothetical protein EDD17DRAFT_1605846 [Pisolithus thermaeus]
MHAAAHRRSSTYNVPPPKRLQFYSNELFSDSRNHGQYQGPVRNVHLPRTTTQGGGTIAKSEDGVRCVVAGRESLRILRLSAQDESLASDHKSAVGRGGHRIEASRNLWEGSGLKIDSASTDVAWCSGSYSSKILTSARNGELIMWDLNKAGSTKYEMKTKNHVRSIHKLSCSTIIPYYCVTGSADGDMRVWDLRDMSRSLMRIHHPTSVRSLVFSPCTSLPLQAIVGLENGSMYRWDLQMGQRGQLDRLPVAHTGAVLSLDWCTTPGTSGTTDDSSPSMGNSWIVSGSLDHTVKVWNLSGPATSSHVSAKPVYTLHPAYPVRRVVWRPDHPCELAVVSNAEFGSGSGSELMASPRLQSASSAFISAAISTTEHMDKASKAGTSGDSVEIWDVRRGWIAKWTVDASVSEGGVTDAVFRDSHALWAQHSSGTFAQIDLRSSNRPIDTITRVALSWSVRHSTDGALTFVTDKTARWEVPYDDLHPNKRALLSERKLRAKCLGDESRMPARQCLGTYTRISPSVTLEQDTFLRLAKKYRVPDNLSQRKEACTQNAEVAIQAGQFGSAQVWLVLMSLLTDVVPGSLVSSVHREAHKDVHAMPLPRSISAPAVGSSTVVSYTSGSTSVPVSVNTTPSDPSASFHRVHVQVTSLQSVSQPRTPTRHMQGRQRTSFTTGTGTSGSTPASNSGRSSASKHQPLLDPSHSTKVPPNSRSHTPVSSATSSPQHHSVPLGPTPAPATSHSSSAAVTLISPAPLPAQKTAPSPTLTMTPRRPSVLGPAPPFAHAPTHVHTHTHSMRGRRPSVFSRSSVVPSAQSESPSVTSSGSLRHVGEGALDDSDSSDEECQREEGAAAGTATVVGEKNRNPDLAGAGEDTALSENQLVRPSIAATRSLSLNRSGPIQPSPLSRLAVQQSWPNPSTEEKSRTDSDEDGSPSPFSTDSEGARRCSDEECDRTKHHVWSARIGSMVKIHPRKTSRVRHGRSRSSTTASLVAPVHPVSPVAVLSPAGSAVNTPLSAHFEQNRKREKEPTRRLSQSSIQTVIAPSLRDPDPDMRTGLPDVDSLVLERWNEMGDQEKKVVMEEEARLHDTTWQAMRDTLEEYADQGDIQMCAMLAIFAAEELRVGLMRTVQFIEAYIETLMRYQLHHTAAYIRKHVQTEDIRQTTGLETTIYTACGRCRKPILGFRTSPTSRGAFAFCSSCRVPVVRCAICHLPVHTLLFQCAVCTHGGHQECYRRYYMERPMDPLPSSTVSRGQLRVTTDVVGSAQVNGKGERYLAGHPCAAGCGHFCWVAATDIDG